MKYDALLIIDMQTALVEAHPWHGDAVIENIKSLLSVCRKNRIPVLYVRHDGGSGDGLEKGSAGWQIHRELAPLPDEKIIDKQYNSAFRKTGLRDQLAALHAERLILCGMQTEYCLDATCKVAFEYGYQVTIPKETTTTFDSAFAGGEALARYFEDNIWNGRHAAVLPVEQVLAEIAGHV